MPPKLLAAFAIVALTSAPATAQTRFAERTPPAPAPAVAPAWPTDGSMPLARFARTSTGHHQAPGVVGGGRMTLARFLGRTGTAVDAAPVGTFGTDFAGFRFRPTRVFLAASPDPSRGPAIARSYRTDAGVTFDPFAARPLRKAVIEARDGSK